MLRRGTVLLQYGAQGASYPINSAPQEHPSGGSASSRMMMQRSQKMLLDPASFIERPPRNTFFNIVPQGHEYVVERLGRYHRTLDSGWWVVVPFIDKIRYNYNVKEQGIEIPNQSAITSDNVMVEIDGVLFLKIVDSCKASYNIENPVFNLINLAQTTMRSEIGRMSLDSLFRERASLNQSTVEVLRREANEWGIECKRYEIRDIVVSELVRRSMDLQAEAERKKRKLILESEGESTATINRANGMKIAQQCVADAEKYTAERQSEGAAAAIRVKAAAVSDNISIVSDAIEKAKHSNEAISLRVAESYIEKFGELAKESNTVVMSQPVSDPATFATQALSVFNTVATSAAKCSPPTGK
ncbi:stomatin-like protein [Leishmania infantum JPCM5]|uniref:Stomatin-like_protein n=3 Tax=Leishmania donovani species complex TaxID=38574 RepID=A0A6L0WM26_LEIIN|nr:stomatin-like protein [Leishmania infantum JPCM5]AYU76010.1 stomatin-like protein [Leishmania donovani]CAC9444240.1 stomatin-like_protein [Leishmania infantum]CAM65414.1 stomatin-like protein [Leishmania infantum JPCM5]SUZ39025.1 stomatin-like_protein [Leishmania infantum]|eukprot:XP_001463067.1 stomatin-like protein [Leishmania infantum JPCM5]